jgi:para-nitrobenzyl esterase
MQDRRKFLKQLTSSGVVLGSAAFLPGAAQAAWLQSLRAVSVAAPCGQVRGAVAGGVRSFKGIPYAQAPLGALRFRAPQALPRSAATLNAFSFGPAPMQPDRVQAGTGRHFIGDVAAGEDCLYLNVWTPDTPGPHPVFVWIYGGSNIYGATSQPLYDGSSFARNGVVCVTIAYRLGAFGFLELGELLGKEYAGSGNNALRDQLMGLQWVQQNIAAFGGDPQRVTLGGESAGAKNVSALLAAPAARGLFRQAIVQSGGGLTTHSKASANEVAGLFLSALQKNRPGPARDVLMNASAEELLRAQNETVARYPRNFAFRSLVDGEFLPQSPQQMVAAGASRDVSLLIGSNRDEALLFFPPPVLAAGRSDPSTSAALTAREMAQLDVATMAVAEGRYRTQFAQQNAFERRLRLLTAEEYWMPTVRLAEAHAAAGGRTFMYRFDVTAKQGPFAGYAVHASEQPFTWLNFNEPFLEMLYGKSHVAPPFADTVHATWVQFIRSGTPSHSRLPAWPRYDIASRTTLLLNDSGSVLADDPAGAERALWDGLL